MSKLVLLRIAQSLLVGTLTGFAIIGAEAVFLHRIPENPGDVIFRILFGLAAGFFAFVIGPWLEHRISRHAARA